MLSLDELTQRIANNEDLDAKSAEVAAQALTAADVSPNSKRDFLTHLSAKGETPTEVTAFAQCFRDLARKTELGTSAHCAIDIVGTGGDKSGSFNISTTVCFILAAAGVPVLKHGNRSITSKCGSADLLEAVGIPTDAPAQMLYESFKKLHFAFFFAPAWHPAFKEIMPVRKALAETGQRTIFNILGPLINPGRPGRQLLGVYSAQWVRPLADSLQQLGVKRGLVVHGMVGGDGVMDELTCAGLNRVCGVGELADIDTTWAPEDFGLKPCSMNDLKGGDLAQNVQILHALLTGSAPKGLRDTVAWNAGSALWIAQKARTMEEGIENAYSLLENGAVEAWLERVAEFYNNKEVSQ